jgi:hypothetical protein
MAGDKVLECKPDMAVYRLENGRYLCAFTHGGVSWTGRGDTQRLAIAAAMFAYGITLDLDLLMNPPDLD